MKPQEETLDPQDWSAMRDLGHRMVDDMMEFLETVRDRPVWQPVPEKDKEHLRLPLPEEPEGAEQAYADFKEHVLPNAMGNIHPRFWGWVIGTGTPLGMLAEMLTGAMNSNTGGYDQGPTYVEHQVLDWCKEMLDFPRDASGLLLSGGSMANLVGLTVGRNAILSDADIRNVGMRGLDRDVSVYGSTETHYTVQRAFEILGIGNQAYRCIPVDREFRIDVAELERALARDRAEGRRPLILVGNAGTVNTGAIDDLQALADIAAREGMWFHVDGAFGALAHLVPEQRGALRGMERADSLAFDLHKWMYVQYEAGCILVRDPDRHRASFEMATSYLSRVDGGFTQGPPLWSDYGPQLSRGFRALKIWMSLKEHGIDRYRRLVKQNIDQATYLASLVSADPELELLAPVPLNIVNFRWIGDGGVEDLNALNSKLLGRLHESGVALPSYTTIDGKFAIRAAITNHRSRRDDFDLLVCEVGRIGREIAAAATTRA